MLLCYRKSLHRQDSGLGCIVGRQRTRALILSNLHNDAAKRSFPTHITQFHGHFPGGVFFPCQSHFVDFSEAPSVSVSALNIVWSTCPINRRQHICSQVFLKSYILSGHKQVLECISLWTDSCCNSATHFPDGA